MPTNFEYLSKEVVNLLSHCHEERLIASYRVGYVRPLIRRESGPGRCEICDTSCATLRCQISGLAQRERLVESLRDKFQDIVTLCPRHGQHKIGIFSNRRCEPTGREVGCISTQPLKDTNSVGLNRAPRHRMGAGARCLEVIPSKPRAVRDSESFGHGRTTKVSSTDEQYVQRQLLVCDAQMALRSFTVPPRGTRRS